MWKSGQPTEEMVREHLRSQGEALSANNPGPAYHSGKSAKLLLELMTFTSSTEESRSAEDSLISKKMLKQLLVELRHRDELTYRHSERVALLATGIAKYLGWDGQQLQRLKLAALLHDIGKIGVPDTVLHKPGEFNLDESELVSLYYNVGQDILQACHADTLLLEIVSQSYDSLQESFTCTVAKSAVHQGARILAVADAYDSMSVHQAYRLAKSHTEIMEELTEKSGTQFDGNIVSTLQSWIQQEGFPYTPESQDSEQNKIDSFLPDTQSPRSVSHLFSYLYLLESMYDGFTIVDSDMKHVLWNRGAEKLFGRPVRTMIGQTWSPQKITLHDSQDRPLPENAYPINQVLENEEPLFSTVRIQHTSGEWIDVEVQTLPITDDQGKLHGIVEIFRNQNRPSSNSLEYKKLQKVATQDALTSVANRGELETNLARWMSDFSSQKKPSPFSVIFLDIDFFKSVNDNYGHNVGDEVLVSLARLMKKECYSGELVGRYGGEEFVILCPDTTLEQGVQRAERLRKAIAIAEVSTTRSEINVTSSFGVSEAEQGDSVESVIRRADKALYVSKETGRNKTTSLTNEQLLSGAAEQQASQSEVHNSFFRREQFFACLASDMVIYKIAGIVDDCEG
ncbi:diguanylate cyclase/phosphodiesterase (GGDEF & EAL domains) with PAS/PAC sensor(s), partial [hydrothermal vent metagenome]